MFAALVALAVEELVEAADALLAPVRLGVVRPTAPFPLATTYVDLVNGSEDLFGVEPLSTGHSRLAHTRRFVLKDIYFKEYWWSDSSSYVAQWDMFFIFSEDIYVYFDDYS